MTTLAQGRLDVMGMPLPPIVLLAWSSHVLPSHCWWCHDHVCCHPHPRSIVVTITSHMASNMVSRPISGGHRSTLWNGGKYTIFCIFLMKINWFSWNFCTISTKFIRFKGDIKGFGLAGLMESMSHCKYFLTTIDHKYYEHLCRKNKIKILKYHQNKVILYIIWCDASNKMSITLNLYIFHV
jgi:hypothetical protein